MLEELGFGVEFGGTGTALEAGVVGAGVGFLDVLREFLISLRDFRTKTTRVLVGLALAVQLSHVTLVVCHAGESCLAYDAQIIVHHSLVMF